MIKVNSNTLKYFKQTAACFRSAISGIFGILGNLGISSRVGILAHFRHFRHFPQSGLAYVAILVLLAIMSTLAMAFLFQAGNLQTVTVNRLAGMQAGYLAEAAANHAIWRLLNDPAFPAAEDEYYMHNLGNGRYGYKVRKPTLTKFATVAAVGTVGSTVVKQSYVPYIKAENILATCDITTSTIPKYMRMFGAGWSPPADTVADGPDSSQWMVLKGCPTRPEFIMGTLDGAADINFAVWNGSAWGNLIEFTSTVGATTYRAFDIAYEKSGRALVVGRYDSTSTVRYNIWNGSAWAFAAAQNAFSIPGGSLTYLTMASNPNSDEILIAAVNTQRDVKVVRWNGSAFTNVVEYEGVLQGTDYGIVDIVYEQQSGHALVITSGAGINSFYYSIWNGTTLTAPILGRNFGSPFNVVRAAADPASDYIFIAAVDSLSDLNVAVWDGNAWIDSRELDTSTNLYSGQVLDVAWEQAGQDVLVAWSSSGTKSNVSYFTWQKGTALADHTVKLGPGLGNPSNLVRLLPVSGASKIILLANNAANQLRHSLWTGSIFIGDPGVILTPTLTPSSFSYDAAESGIAYTGGSG